MHLKETLHCQNKEKQGKHALRELNKERQVKDVNAPGLFVMPI